MDPFSDSGELFNIQRSFYTGDHNQVISTDISGYKEENKIQAQVLQLRAKVALGRSQDVISELNNATQPELKIVKSFAEYINGARDVAMKQAEELIKEHGDNHQVEHIGGLMLLMAGRPDEALKLLSRHQGSLECISLMVQIYLIQGNVDKASKEIESAKKWAQDNIVFNLAESWVELRKGGRSSCQSAYYIYEELPAGMGQTAKALNGKAVANYCQPTRTDNLDKQEKQQLNDQRQGTLKEALELDGDDADVLANSIAAAIINGEDYSDLESKLEQVDKDHPSLVDLQAKEANFQKVLEKYSKT